MRLYFDIQRSTKKLGKELDPGIYVTRELSYEEFDDIGWAAWHLAANSERVWQEEQSYVTWFKNKLNPNNPVDMKEFLFIKLRAKEL